jgi:hypothetical protein
MIAAGLRIVRPGAEVKSTTTEGLEEGLERFDPQVVICGGYEDVEGYCGPAWIELSLNPTQPTKIGIDGGSLERINPGVATLVEITNEVE